MIRFIAWGIGVALLVASTMISASIEHSPMTPIENVRLCLMLASCAAHGVVLGYTLGQSARDDGQGGT